MTAEWLRGHRPAEEHVRVSPSSWIVRQPSTSPPRLRLFCFPFAGGGASLYRGWRDSLPEAVEVCALQLPGRENRFGEPLLAEMEAVVEGAITAIDPLMDLPYAFFGHSMGAVIAFETARRLAQGDGRQPSLIAVSGRPAPFLPARVPPMHELSDADFIAGLRRLEGTPAEVLENDELMQLVLPILRADFRIIETYRWHDGPPLDTRLLVLGGAADAETDQASLEAWGETTLGDWRCEILPGGHFFVMTARERVLSILFQELEACFRLPRSGQTQARSVS